MKKLFLSMVLLIATLSANTQFGEPDFDAKHATDVAAWKKTCQLFGITYTQVSELKKFRETDIEIA